MSHLLIVEDQPELGRLLAASLEAAGFEVRVTTRVKDAIRALPEIEPVALLVDLMLPDALGFEVAKAAKARDPAPVVIAVSGVFRQDPTVREALTHGTFDAFFEKPFKLGEVVEQIESLLPGRETRVAEPAPSGGDTDPLVRFEASVVEGTPQDYLFEAPEAGLAAALRARAEEAAPAEPPTEEVTAGTLGEITVPRLINAFYVSRESGELHLQRGKVRKVVYFHEGVPAFAASNLRRDRFDELLLRRGALDEDAIREAATLAGEQGERIDRVLLERRLLSPSRHRSLVTEQVKEILFSLFPWREGTWKMTFQHRAEAEPVRLDIFPADLILEGVGTLAQPTLQGLLPGDTRLAPAPAPAYELYDLSLSGEQALVVSRLDGTRTVDDVAAEGWLPPRETSALLYGLLCLEVVEDASLLLL